ncbi:2OG-Fe(II) oxygenase [Amycolatopsis sp. NBC_00348]|uniref:2OG-Fe(II) oxygenase family protein n=1 Tax=Amycolatopsis sp. NBC_00348 TaxID=2975956 RepID=UPI002E266158
MSATIDHTAGLFAGWTPPRDLPFHWHIYDVGSALPAGWIDELLDVARRQAARRSFRPTMTTARETADAVIPLESVDGAVLVEQAPWVNELYTGWFRQLGERLADEPLELTSTANRALSLNVQRGITMRYPCHVDSNPVEGLLYLTDCTEETGGGLVVSRNRHARDVSEVDADAAVIYPRRGQLFFFDARFHPHYVQPLRTDDTLRAVVTMNYYTRSIPEAVRPEGLDEQLFGAGTR